MDIAGEEILGAEANRLRKSDIKKIVTMPKDPIKVLEMIAADMKNDAAAFDGQLFDGKTVATYFGNQGAAIAALAGILKQTIEQKAGQKENDINSSVGMKLGG